MDRFTPLTDDEPSGRMDSLASPPLQHKLQPERPLTAQRGFMDRFAEPSGQPDSVRGGGFTDRLAGSSVQSDSSRGGDFMDRFAQSSSQSDSTRGGPSKSQSLQAAASSGTVDLASHSLSQVAAEDLLPPSDDHPIETRAPVTG